MILYAGVGVDSPHNKWVYDTTQFDNILKKLKVVRQVKDYLSVPPMKFRFTMSNNCSHLFLVILVIVFLCKSSNQLILFKKVYLAHWFCTLLL